jgi:cell division protein FtsI (penicillin-binding protein 3)
VSAAAPQGNAQRRKHLGAPGVPQAAHTRAYLAIGLLTLALCGIAVRSWRLQISSGDRFRDQAARQHAITVEIPAPRGAIVDRLGRPLAITANADSVWADPREVRDVAGTAEMLAQMLDGDVRILEEKLGSERRFVWLARRIQPELAAAVKKAKLPGIVVSQEPHRYYPARTVGGTLIGRANIDGHGSDGLELMMDKVLRGQRSRIAGLRDARGRAVLSDGLTPAVPGAQVQLTIDQTIQSIAENALAETMLSSQAKSGVVVVLDVATSQVLGMASAPVFNPNEASAEQAAAASRSRAVADAYEIGSIMKLFAVASALDAGVTHPDELFDTEGGAWRLGSKTIRDVHHDQQLTTSEIIKRSSNIGSAKLALRLGRERLAKGLRQLGFGRKTGIELPGEQGGLVRDARNWREIELATISYGYGLTVTPLQVAAAVAAIGNGGVWNAPRIVAKVTSDRGELLERPVAPPVQAISAKTAAAMLPMLASVFEGGQKAGTAAKIVVDGFRCGGKSGTAHKWDPVIKTYSPTKYLSSFAGLAPIGAPRLAILVLIDEPSGGDYFGGKIAAPVFAKVASEALRYLGVPGEPKPEIVDPKAAKIAAAKNATAKSMTSKLAAEKNPVAAPAAKIDAKSAAKVDGPSEAKADAKIAGKIVAASAAPPPAGDLHP